MRCNGNVVLREEFIIKKHEEVLSLVFVLSKGFHKKLECEKERNKLWK
jgi:hypothetical protein